MDGVKDGIIANIYNARMNRESFAKHIKEKYHLTGAQMNTIKVYEEGFSLDYAMASGVRKYQGYVKKYGQDCVDKFIKFYCMPAAAHCSGIFMDYLEWLDIWCTNGRYPEETLYGTMEKTGGQRPYIREKNWVKASLNIPFCMNRELDIWL